MTPPPSIFRRTYDAVAIFALLNLFGAGVLVVYACASGLVNADTIRRVVDSFRYVEEPEPEAVVEPEVSPAESPEPARMDLSQVHMNSQVLRLQAERISAELDQRLALNNAIALRISQDRELFRKERDAEAKRRSATASEQDTAGYKKQIEIFEALSPKVAIQHLLDMQDADEAARVLLHMDTRKARKVIEAAKKPQQLEKMKIILHRLRQASPEKSGEIGATGG